MVKLPPAPTPFVGRQDELGEIARQLSDPACRLLTLVGPGGIGKTRLATEAARQLSSAHFVPLQPLTSPDVIVSAIAAAIGFQFDSGADPKQQLLDYLREKSGLIVLDNFEHLLDGATLLSEILAAAPALRLLVTSRERLNVQEEWVMMLDGLRFPTLRTREALETYSAVELFDQRARQMQANFVLGDNAEAVTTICQQVEGMPLGLELAASWLRVMSSRQIAARMGDSVNFLTTPLRNVPERHRSLRAVFEQSWNLLSNNERNVLMRLSVFRGGFDLEAAEQIAEANLNSLAALADKSLIRLNVSGRYDLHELLRQFAADKLSADEARAVADQHLNYFLQLAEQAEAHQYGDEQAIWFDRVEADFDNVRAALDWSLEGGAAERGLLLNTALNGVWSTRIHPQEGLMRSRQLLIAAQNAPLTLRAKALHRTADLACMVGRPDDAKALCLEALALARQINDQSTIAWSLSSLGNWILLNKSYDERAALLEESLVMFRQLDDPHGLSHILFRRGWIAIYQQDYGYAQALLDERLMRARAVGDKSTTAWALALLALNALRRGDKPGSTAAQLEESLTLFREVSDFGGVPWTLGLLARLEQVAGHNARAQTLYKEVLLTMRQTSKYGGVLSFSLAGLGTLLDGQGMTYFVARLFGAAEHFKQHPLDFDPFPSATLDTQIAAVRAQLGDAAFDAAFAEGKAMTDEQAVVYALDEVFARMETSQPSPRAKQSSDEPLSVRELEVLRLIGDGLTNAEIAHKLSISVATVKTHAGNIYGKLGVSNRTQAVTQAQNLNLL